MNDPIQKNFINLVGNRVGMTLILLGCGFLAMFLFVVMLVIASMFNLGEAFLFFSILAIPFLLVGLFVGGLLWALKRRQKIMGTFQQSFGWLGPESNYLINGRQYHGQVNGSPVNIKIHNRSRGHGAVMNIDIPAEMPGMLTIGTRTSLGGLLQGLTSSYEVKSTVFDSRPFALNTVAEHEGFAKWFAEQPNLVRLVDQMMQPGSGTEVRAIRFDKSQVSMVISRPVQEIYRPDVNQQLAENLVQLIQWVNQPESMESDSNETSVIAAEVIADDEENVVRDIQVVD